VRCAVGACACRRVALEAGRSKAHVTCNDHKAIDATRRRDDTKHAPDRSFQLGRHGPRGPVLTLVLLNFHPHALPRSMSGSSAVLSSTSAAPSTSTTQSPTPAPTHTGSTANTGIYAKFAIGGLQPEGKRGDNPQPSLFRRILGTLGRCRVVERGGDGNCYPLVIQASLDAAGGPGKRAPTIAGIRYAGVDAVTRWFNGTDDMDAGTALLLAGLIGATPAVFNAWCTRVRCDSFSVSLSSSLQLLFPLLFSALSRRPQLTHSPTPSVFFFLYNRCARTVSMLTRC
jgi:hypothetical protein